MVVHSHRSPSARPVDKPLIAGKLGSAEPNALVLASTTRHPQGEDCSPACRLTVQRSVERWFDPAKRVRVPL